MATLISRLPSLLQIVFGCVVAYLLTSYLRAYLRLRQFPGPWLACTTPVWLFYETCRGQKHLALQQLHTRYGSLARVNIDSLITDDPELFKFMNSTASPFSRGRWYNAHQVEPNRDTVFSTRNKEEHAALKSKLNPGYSGRDSVDFELAIDPVVQDLAKVVRGYSDAGSTFDFSPLPGYFTVDSLARLAFGKEIGYLRENVDLFEYFKQSYQFLVILELATDHPWVLAILNFAKPWIKPSREDKLGMGAIMGVAYQAIDEQFDSTSTAKSSNSILASWQRKGLTREQCQNEVMISILAGSESTSQVIRSCFTNIIAAPVIYGRLTAEIKTAIESNKISRPVIKNTEANALPYLQACIKEGLRIMQPLNGLQSKQAPPEGVNWKGSFIPGGTEIGVAQYSMLRRKDVFGSDAEMYRPERWLDGTDPARLQNMQNVLGMAFGGGSGLCLGKSIAFMELNKVIFELFRNFDYQLTDPFAEIATQVRGIVTQQGINIKAYPKSF